MDFGAFDATQTALLIADLQNDFVHADGAYARGGQANAEIAAVPGRVAPVAAALRDKGGWIVSTHFTLVPGKGGEPIYFTASEGDAAVSQEGRLRAGRMGARAAG